MNDFRPGDFQEAVARFRDAVHQEGERTASPGLDAILARERRSKRARLRFAVAAMVVLALGAIPAYENARHMNAQRQREAAQARADALLLEQVNAGLSRSVPRAMAPLMGWAPGN
jgi:hypothetical protein